MEGEVSSSEGAASSNLGLGCISEFVSYIEMGLSSLTCEQTNYMDSNSEPSDDWAVPFVETNNRRQPQIEATVRPNKPVTYVQAKYFVPVRSSRSLFDLAKPDPQPTGDKRMLSRSNTAPASLFQSQDTLSPTSETVRPFPGRDTQLMPHNVSLRQKHFLAREQARLDAPIQRARLQRIHQEGYENKDRVRRSLPENLAVSGVGRFARSSH